MSLLVNVILLLLGDAAVYIIGNSYYNVFPTNGSPLYLAVLTAAILLAAFLLRRTPGKKARCQAAIALAAATAASLLLSTGIYNFPFEQYTGIRNLADDIISQFIHVVPLILVMTLLACWKLRVMCFQVGELKALPRFDIPRMYPCPDSYGEQGWGGSKMVRPDSKIPSSYEP